MSYALMKSTHITYQVTVTVNVNVNADKALLVLFACIAFGIWQMKRYIYHLSLFVHDALEALAFTATVMGIALRAVLYGVVGVRL